MSSIQTYLQGVKAEFDNIVWPDRRTATVLTVLVVIISLLTAAYLGALDYVFTLILDNFIV